MTFTTYHRRKGHAVWLITDDRATYETREEAQAHLDRELAPGGRLSASAGLYDFKVDTVSWSHREATRFAQGAYTQPVWHKEKFWSSTRTPAMVQHYAHVSTDDPSMLAYTEDDAKGEKDIQNKIKPGKYLQKFYGEGKKGVIGFGPFKGQPPKLTPREIAFYAEWWEKGSKPSKFSAWKLKYATTPDEIVATYIDGPRSCMTGSHRASFGREDANPTRVYGAGDLQLAYLEDERRKVRARCLVWHEKKAFGRCYPAPDNYSSDGFGSPQDAQECQDDLANRMLALGYVSVYKDPSVLEGARLLRLPLPDNGKHVYVMPYLDNGYMISPHEDERFFKMTRRGEWAAGSTNGYVSAIPTVPCDNCGGRVTEDQTREVFSGYDKEQGAILPEQWCGVCRRHYAFMCEGTDHYYRTTAAAKEGRPGVRRSTVRGANYASPWAKKQGLYTCAITGERNLESRDPSVRDANGQRVCRTEAPFNGFICRMNDTFYPFRETSLIHCGFPASMDADDISPEMRAAGDLHVVTSIYNPERGQFAGEDRFTDYLRYFHRTLALRAAAEQQRQELAKAAAAEKRRQQRARAKAKREALDAPQPVILAAE